MLLQVDGRPAQLFLAQVNKPKLNGDGATRDIFNSRFKNN